MTGREISASAQVAGELLGERLRQVEIKDWSLTDDDKLQHGQLAQAAAAHSYAASFRTFVALHGSEIRDGRRMTTPAELWPFEPNKFHSKGARTDLIRAGALIIAEIERHDRAAAALNATGVAPCLFAQSQSPKPKPKP